MSVHRFALTSLLLLAALAAPNMAQTASAQTADPTTAPATPDPTQAPGASASPALEDGSGQGTAAQACEWATKPSVVDFMGDEPISIAEQPSDDARLGGCEVIFSNSTSIIVRVNDAAGWQDLIGSLDFEPVADDGTLYYSEIVGLAWRPSAADTYLSLRVTPVAELEGHYQVLSLMLEDG